MDYVSDVKEIERLVNRGIVGADIGDRIERIVNLIKEDVYVDGEAETENDIDRVGYIYGRVKYTNLVWNISWEDGIRSSLWMTFERRDNRKLTIDDLLDACVVCKKLEKYHKVDCKKDTFSFIRVAKGQDSINIKLLNQ